MQTARILVLLATCLVQGVAIAGAPAGPAAADQILRQNPQIGTLSGIPGNLKGVSVQDCPRGGTPDISRSRCVVAHAPSTTRTFILVLHPDSPKVWGVFERNAAGQTALLAEFDTGGDVISPRGGASASKKKVTKQDVAGQASGPATDGQGGAQVAFDNRLLGKWTGVGGRYTGLMRDSSTLEISPDAIKYRKQVGDEGKYTMYTATFKWSPMQDRLRNFEPTSGAYPLLFSTSQQSRSKEDILRVFQAYKERFKDPPFQAMKKGSISRMDAALANAPPAKYSMFLLYENGEVSELIFDGQNIWTHVTTHEGDLELFTRINTK